MDEKASRKSQLQNDQVMDGKQKSKNKKIILDSPHSEVYFKKFYHKKNQLNLTKFFQKFRKKRISYLNSLLYPVHFQIKKLYESKNHKLVKLQVAFSYFFMVINVLNICQSKKLSLKFDKIINEGMYGTIHETSLYGKKYAIKEISYNLSNSSSIIRNAIKQFCIMKLMSTFQVAPVQSNIFGFDLVTTQNAVYFSMQKCVPLDQIKLSQKTDSIQNLRGQLQNSLLIMHSFNLTHNDIKPDNIMFSPSFNKFVFVDFGLSQQNIQYHGQMKQENAKGSLFYCCYEMKKIFFDSGIGYVDMYYNDYVGFQKTIAQLEQVFLLKKTKIKQKSLQKNHKLEYTSKQTIIIPSSQNVEIDKSFFEQNNSQINLLQETTQAQYQFVWIYTVYLIFEENISELKKIIQSQEIVSVINNGFQAIYFVFLQMEFSLNFYKIYLLIINAIKSSKISVFNVSQHIDQFYLKPYFNYCVNFFYGPNNSVTKIYMNENILLGKKIYNRYSLKKDQNLQSQQNQQILQIVIDQKYCGQKQVNKIFIFLSQGDGSKIRRLCQDGQNLFNFLVRNLENLQFNRWVLKNFFSKLGINFKLLKANEVQQWLSISKQINFYIFIINSIFFRLSSQYSTLELFRKFKFGCKKTKQNNQVLQKLISRSDIFIEGLKQFCCIRLKYANQSNQAMKTNKKSMQMYIQEFIQEELNKFHFFLDLLVKSSIYIHLVGSYQKFYQVIKNVLQLFNRILVQFIALLSIIKSFQDIQQDLLFFLQSQVQIKVQKLLYFRSQVLLHAFLPADSNHNINNIIQIIEKLFDKNKIVQFPSNFVALCSKVGIQFRLQKFIQVLNLRFKNSLGVNSQIVTYVGQVYSLILFNQIIPKQIYENFGMFSKFTQISEYILQHGNSKFLLTFMKGLIDSKILNIAIQEDRFDEFLYYFKQIENQQNLNNINDYDVIILRFYDRINYSKKIAPDMGIFEKVRTSNFTFQQKFRRQYVECQDTQFLKERNNPKEKCFNQLIYQNTYNLLDRKNFRYYKNLQALQKRWKRLINEQNFEGLQQFKLQTLNVSLYYLIRLQCQNIQDYFTEYKLILEKIISSIAQSIGYIEKNSLISSYIFASLKFVNPNQNFWQKLKLDIQVILRLKLVRTFLLFSNKQNLNSDEQIFGILFQNYSKQTFQYISSKLGENGPLVFFQIQIQIQLRKIRNQRLNNQTQKINRLKLIQKYFQKLNQKYQFELVEYEMYLNLSQYKVFYFNRYSNQQMYLDILIETQKGRIPEINSIYILELQQQKDQRSKVLSKTQKIETHFKLLFYFMAKHRQINRFFSFKITYLEFLYYLVRIAVKKLVNPDKCQSLNDNKQSEGKKNSFILEIFEQLFKFSSKLSCSNYSYFCIKVIKLFFLFLGNQTKNCNTPIKLIRIIDKINLQVMRKVDYQNDKKIYNWVIILIGSQIIKQNWLKEYQNQQIIRNQEKHIIDYDFIRKILFKVTQNLESLEYLAKTYTKQRVYKLMLLLIQSNFHDKIRSINSSIFVNIDGKQQFYYWKEKYIRLKHLRSVRLLTSQEYNNLKKSNFILKINQIQEIFEEVSVNIYKNQMLLLFKNSFSFSHDWVDQQEQNLSFLHNSVLQMIKKKIQKRIKNLL